MCLSIVQQWCVNAYSQITAADEFSTCSFFIINLDSKPKSLSQDSIHHTSIRSPVHLKMRLCFAFAINDPGSFFEKQNLWIASEHSLPPFCFRQSTYWTSANSTIPFCQHVSSSNPWTRSVLHYQATCIMRHRFICFCSLREIWQEPSSSSSRAR